MGAKDRPQRHLHVVPSTDADAATELRRLWQESGLETTGTDPSIRYPGRARLLAVVVLAPWLPFGALAWVVLT